MNSNALRRAASAALAAALLALGGCAVTPDTRPAEVRQLAAAPAEPFTSITLVFMPVQRPAGRDMARVYDETWRQPEAWREGFFRRLERNFAHNGLELRVFDVAAGGRVTIEPHMLQLRMHAESIILEKTWMRFAMRGEAMHRQTPHLAWYELMYLVRWPEREADRQTYLILNALRDARLIKAPADGGDYKLAP